MSLSRFSKALPFALLLAGCASTSKAVNETASAPANAQAQVDEKDSKTADELRKKERELEYARQQLVITQLSQRLDETSARRALEAAERELAEAQAELGNFTELVRALDAAERVLAVDRSKQNLVEAQQELAELEAMYRQEDFAETTKELVLVRGRSRLEMAQRGLDLAERRLAQLQAFEQPRRERELSHKAAKAEQSADEARAKLEKLGLDQALALLKAQHGIEELEREVQKLRAKTAD